MTVSIATARDVVIGVVAAALAAAPSTASLPVRYDNVRSNTPASGATATADAEYVVLTVRNLSSPQTTQGRRRWQSTGAFSVQIFGPIGDGSRRVDEIAQVVLNAIRSHVGSANGVWFFDQVYAEVGLDGAHFQANVSSSFRYQQGVSE